MLFRSARQPAECPHPRPSLPRRLSRERKAEDPKPTCRIRDSAGRAPGSPCTGNAHPTPHNWQQAVWTWHTLADPVQAVVRRTHSMLRQAAEMEYPDTHTATHTAEMENPHTQTQLNAESAHVSWPWSHPDRHRTHHTHWAGVGAGGHPAESPTYKYMVHSQLTSVLPVNQA